MRKLALLALVLVSLAICNPETVSVIVNVRSIFELRLDRQVVEIKDANPGSWIRDIPDNEGIKVTVVSNNGQPWELKINNLQELSNGKHSIPNSNFYWNGYPSASSVGKWYGKGNDPMSLSPVLAYRSGSAEYNNYPNGTELFFKFDLNIPKKQNSGIYRSTVAFTLTE